MGCLNDNGQFKHWFGNIHFSGPCNRRCYFCIGQHMMALDKYNNLNKWPLDGFSDFLDECLEKNVTEINLTGTNTDPLLYKHLELLTWRLQMSGYIVGIRTNAVLKDLNILNCFNKGSVTICSLDSGIYKSMMGLGEPPDIDEILKATENWNDLKINIVLGPENTDWIRQDVITTCLKLATAGVKKINLREPYGQPHIGDPLAKIGLKPQWQTYGMPTYKILNCDITYWDVHYVEVESINLYASGRVSSTYPITKGHDDSGIVLDQSNFTGGRVREQWIYDK